MTRLSPRSSLVDILVAHGQLSADEVRAADGPVTREWLVGRQRISAEHLAAAMAEQLALPLTDLGDFSVPRELFDVLPAEQAYRLKVVPYRLREHVLEAVVADPYDLVARENIERLAGRPVHYAVASAEAILDCLKRSQGGFEVLQDVSKDFRLMVVVENREGAEEYVSLEDMSAERDGTIVKLVNSLLMAALQKRASDIHIEAGAAGTLVKYRIDGALHPAMDPIDAQHHPALVSRIKVMASLDIAEHRVPQDGRFRLRHGDRGIDFRVSVLPSVHGEDIAVRILDGAAALGEDGAALRLDSLGMSPDVLRDLRRGIHAPYGMVLVAGPTGSGKTTTLYAALREFDVAEEKIITIEDPVEYQLPGVVQIPVNEKKGLTFATGLRSILRHDPDKILVGEIRDAETAQIAVQSALTGHLVLSTLHANGAVEVVERLRHMGIDAFDFTSVITCVLAQRLIRRICPQCRHTVRVKDEELTALGMDAAAHRKTTWYDGRGCEHCLDTGYRDRVAIGELMPMTPAIKRMLVQRAPIDEVQEEARRLGMTTLRQAAVQAAVAGITSLKEVRRVTLAG